MTKQEKFESVTKACVNALRQSNAPTTRVSAMITDMKFRICSGGVNRRLFYGGDEESIGVHAEMHALMEQARCGRRPAFPDYCLFLAADRPLIPCVDCMYAMANLGVKRIYLRDNFFNGEITEEDNVKYKFCTSLNVADWYGIRFYDFDGAIIR